MALRVLALRAAGIGDLLTAVPALRALSDWTPLGAVGDTEVVLATDRWLFDLAALIPGVAGVRAVEDLRPLDPPRSDLVVNLHGSGPQSHEALLGLGPRLLAYRCPGIWPDGPDWWDEEDERERWCRLLRWAGIPADSTRTRIRRPPVPSAQADVIVLHLGAKSPDRRWPAAHFAELVRALSDQPLVLTGEAAQRPVARQIIQISGSGAIVDLTGRLNLQELAALVSSARLVVSGDTGVAHLATAYGIPSVTIFAAASPVRWGPPPLPRHRVVRPNVSGRPTVADVPAREVLPHVEELLAEGSAA